MTSRAALRRHAVDFPLATRWRFVRRRLRYASTWHEVWSDLTYLVRG